MAPIHLVIEHELHRATPGGTGGVKTIGNYAAVSYIFLITVCSYFSTHQDIFLQFS